jgi:hypothetical protein
VLPEDAGHRHDRVFEPNTTISTGRTARSTPLPLKPLSQPVILQQYRVRRQTRVGGTINEYRLVA